MTTLDPDMYGRTVQFSTDGTTDTYQVFDGADLIITVTRKAGVPLDIVYDTINSMGPG